MEFKRAMMQRRKEVYDNAVAKALKAGGDNLLR
jgi:hypothetical protein